MGLLIHQFLEYLPTLYLCGGQYPGKHQPGVYAGLHQQGHQSHQPGVWVRVNTQVKEESLNRWTENKNKH